MVEFMLVTCFLGKSYLFCAYKGFKIGFSSTKILTAVTPFAVGACCLCGSCCPTLSAELSAQVLWFLGFLVALGVKGTGADLQSWLLVSSNDVQDAGENLAPPLGAGGRHPALEPRGKTLYPCKLRLNVWSQSKEMLTAFAVRLSSYFLE